MVKSQLSDVQLSDRPIHLDILDCLKTNSERVLVVDGLTSREYTGQELHDSIIRVASGLRRHGLKQHDILAISSRNSPEFIIMFCASLCCGSTVSTLNPAYKQYEIEHNLQQTKPKFVFATQDIIQDIKFVIQKMNVDCIIVTDGSAPGAVSYSSLANDSGSLYPHNLTIQPKEDVALIQPSSGTTGLPKQVQITHYNVSAYHSIRRHQNLARPPVDHIVGISILPYFHVYGLHFLLIRYLYEGNIQIVLPKFVPELYLLLIEKYKVNVLTLVPPIVVFLAKSPLVERYNVSSVVAAVCGSAPLAKDTEQEFMQKFNITEMKQGYGMTEATTSCTWHHQGAVHKPGSVGGPLPNCEMQVVDLDTGRVLGPNQRGEIWFKGPNIMKGYLNNPEATRTIVDENGWLHTGDIGYHDEEGMFYIVDRLKELIKYKGFQVAPAELEGLLLNHPDVEDVAVIGIPDPGAGELPRAYVVRKPGVSLTEAQVKAFIADNLSSFKQLRGGVEFMASVPKSPSGKILRRELRDRLKNSKL